MNSIPAVFSAIFWLCLEFCTQVSWMCSISVPCSKTVTRKCRQGPLTFLPCENLFFWKDSWNIFLSTVTTEKWGAGALHCLNMTPQSAIWCNQTEASAMAPGIQWNYESKSKLQFSSTNFSMPKQNKDLKTAVTILCHHISSMLSFALYPSALIVIVKETTIAVSAVTLMGGEPSSSSSHDTALLFNLKLTIRAFCK